MAGHRGTRLSSSIRLLLAFLLLVFLPCGCADLDLKGMFDFTGSAEDGGEISAQSLAVEAMDDYDVGKYYSALEGFEKIMELFPFSPQAMLAELKAADCRYYMGQYEEAKTLYQQFEEHHPTNEAVPYVMFQIGMCDYNRIDRIDRDITGAQNAITAFSRLLRAFPDSPYTQEAGARMAAAEEFLVNHEYFVTMFYLRAEKYNQAEARLRSLLAAHPDSKIAGKAKKLLARLQAGDPPKRTLKDWLPDLSLPDWKLF